MSSSSKLRCSVVKWTQLMSVLPAWWRSSTSTTLLTLIWPLNQSLKYIVIRLNMAKSRLTFWTRIMQILSLILTKSSDHFSHCSAIHCKQSKTCEATKNMYLKNSPKTAFLRPHSTCCLLITCFNVCRQGKKRTNCFTLWTLSEQYKRGSHLSWENLEAETEL